MKTLRIALALVGCWPAPAPAPSEAPARRSEIVACETKIRKLLSDGQTLEAVEQAVWLTAAVKQAIPAPDPNRCAALELASLAFRAAGRHRESAELAAEVGEGWIQVWEKGREGAGPQAAVSAHYHAAEDLEFEGEYAKALVQYNRALEIQNRIGMPYDSIRFDILWSTGRLLCGLGDVKLGFTRLSEAVEFAERRTPPDAHAVAKAKSSLAFLAIALGRNRDASRLLNEAGQYYAKKDLKEEMSKSEGTEFMLILIGHCILWRLDGQPERAEASLERMLVEMKRHIYGELDVVIRSELGLDKLALRKFKEAEQQFDHIVRSIASVKGQRPASAVAAQLLAIIRGIELGQPEVSVSEIRDLLDEETRILRRGFDYQSDRQRLVAVKSKRSIHDIYLTLAIESKCPAAEIYERVTAWKGAVFARSEFDATLVAASKNDGARLQSLRDQIAAVARELRARDVAPVAGTAPRGLGVSVSQQSLRDENATAIPTLRARLERLEQERAELVANIQGAASVSVVSWQEIADNLPDDTALIDYVVYNHFVAGTGPKNLIRTQPSVLAFVLRPKKPVTLIRLETTEELINQIISQWNAQLGDWNEAGTAPNDDLRVQAERMKKAVWEPLIPCISGVKAVIVSPDGNLWRFPFAALPGNGARRFLIEDYPIAYSLSGRHAREMFRPERGKVGRAGAGLLIVGDIDYGPQMRGGGNPTLEHAGTWVKRIMADSKGRYGDGPIQAVTRSKATAKNVLSELGVGYREIIFYGHGPNDSADPNADLFPFEAMAQHLEQPLLSWTDSVNQVYLPMAGANAEVPGGASYLSPVDILPVAMPGVETLWCWMCIASRGPSVRGEGIVGFPRAFLIAGCESVLTSFVAVEDRPTEQFSRLVHACVRQKGQSPGQALRQIQLYCLSDRSSTTMSHPKYWSPWIVIGDVGFRREVDLTFEPEMLVREIEHDSNAVPLTDAPHDPPPSLNVPMVIVTGAVILAVALLLYVKVRSRLRV